MADRPELIAVDLDGTLAAYEEGMGIAQRFEVGPPIPKMLARVKHWLAEGIQVVIFTARVSPDHENRSPEDEQKQRAAIIEWCKEHVGQELPVTCIKSWKITRIYDDKAIGVTKNEGELVGVLEGDWEIN